MQLQLKCPEKPNLPITWQLHLAPPLTASPQHCQWAKPKAQDPTWSTWGPPLVWGLRLPNAKRQSHFDTVQFPKPQYPVTSKCPQAGLPKEWTAAQCMGHQASAAQGPWQSWAGGWHTPGWQPGGAAVFLQTLWAGSTEHPSGGGGCQLLTLAQGRNFSFSFNL